MKIEVDEYGETLTVNGTAFDADFDGVFEVLAFHLQNESLKELPVGIRVRLVNLVAARERPSLVAPHARSSVCPRTNGWYILIPRLRLKMSVLRRAISPPTSRKR
jgi:hypothetical protein